MAHHQTLICQHVFEGAIPELVIIEEANMTVASCFACADVVQNGSPEEASKLVTPACPHDQIPNKHLWNLDAHFPEDGVYQLIESQYCRQPETMAPMGNA